MDLNKRIVIEISMHQLWTSQGVLDAERGVHLTKADIRNILKIQPVDFVVADVGKKLNWISSADCFTFWKSQVESHVADNLSRVILGNSPDEYAFIASKWATETRVIVLLETYH